MTERARPRGLALVLAATLFTLVLAWALRAPCLGPWTDGRQYNRLCYSDVAALYGTPERGLSEGLLPYLEAKNEYPVLTGLSMWAAAIPSEDYASFFSWTALLLSAAALVTAAMLHRLAGPRALLFALAPTLAVYAFVNWDLLAVAFATAGTLAFLRKKDMASGLLLGLGAAAKLYPALLVVPFALQRLREGARLKAAHLVALTVGTWTVLNLPFALASFERWSEFFTFNSVRPADWDSLWYISGRQLGFVWDVPLVNALSAAAFLVAAVLLWVGPARRLAPADTWKAAFPLLIAFLLTSKVYSPQYGLWLLPWFALVFPDLRFFAAFQLADVAVFVTRFQFFARLEGIGEGMPQWSFELAVAVRAVILVVCVFVWARLRSAKADAPGIPAMAGAR